MKILVFIQVDDNKVLEEMIKDDVVDENLI